ncbi:hypothetical protein BJ742DRAFT_243786 [Cladochytrium replicatum]|nr:hypothetical protein BJ742DRAFT_243786 [Cladochytrium replicatum]
MDGGTANEAMTLRLVVVKSAIVPMRAVVVVDDEGITFGRDSSATDERRLKLKELSVSRCHANLYVDAVPTSQEEIMEVSNKIVTSSEEPEDNFSATFEDGELLDGGEEGEIQEEQDFGYSETLRAASNTNTECGWFIVDFGSTHGTFVNRERLSGPKISSLPCRLNHLDTLQIGSTVFQVHIHPNWCCNDFQLTDTPPLSTLNAVGSPKTTESRLPLTKKRKRITANPEPEPAVVSGEPQEPPPPPTPPSPKRTYVDRAKLRRNLHGSSAIDQNIQTFRNDLRIDRVREEHHLALVAAATSSIALRSQDRVQNAISQQPPPIPQPRIPPPSAPSLIEDKSNVGHRLLKRMGWSDGQGIGPVGRQGAVEPLSVAANTGRRGLGSGK